MSTCLANGQRQTTKLNYEIMWDTKPRTTPHTTSQPLMGLEQDTTPKILQDIL
jgi:hypothetical protein